MKRGQNFKKVCVYVHASVRGVGGAIRCYVSCSVNLLLSPLRHCHLLTWSWAYSQPAPAITLPLPSTVLG